MAEMSKLGATVGGFILLIVGIVLFSVTADSVYDANNLHQAPNETLDFTQTFGQNVTSAANDDIVSVDFVGNTTDDLTSELDTNINWTRAGVFTVDGVTVVNATYNVTYNFEGDSYVADSNSRTILSLINIFFALWILGAAIFVMMQMGIVDLLLNKK